GAPAAPLPRPRGAAPARAAPRLVPRVLRARPGVCRRGRRAREPGPLRRLHRVLLALGILARRPATLRRAGAVRAEGAGAGWPPRRRRAAGRARRAVPLGH